MALTISDPVALFQAFDQHLSMASQNSIGRFD